MRPLGPAVIALLFAGCGDDGMAATDGASPSSDGAVHRDAAASDGGVVDSGRFASAQNPVLGVDHPDPHVLRVVGLDGKPTYYLTATVGTGDIGIYRSSDLLAWSRLPDGAFRVAAAPGDSIALNGKHYCGIWAPQLVAVAPSSFLLTFTAQKYATAQHPCPPYREDGGVYVASSSSPTGPFAAADHAWEPLPAGAQLGVCPAMVRDAIPHSVDDASPECQGGPCAAIARLDSDVFHDEKSGRWWLSYAWYTNTPPRVSWETAHYGEHTSIVELSPTDPFAVKCDLAVPQIFAADSHDGATLARLATSCPRCGEMNAWDRDRAGNPFVRDGFSWAVNEGPNLFRRGEWVYLLVSGGVWDSAYYSVYWIAARDVEGLAGGDPSRLVGRYLVPSLDQSFGHGTAVLGPDGVSWYFVHHRLRHGACKATGDCARDVFVSPIDFEDRGDGRGAVWIKARFPAEQPTVRVFLPK